MNKIEDERREKNKKNSILMAGILDHVIVIVILT